MASNGNEADAIVREAVLDASRTECSEGGASRLEEARRLRAAGFSVIPVVYGSKRPRVRWVDFQSHAASDAQLLAWFAVGESNIGVVTGAISDVVVVDADSLDGLRWCTRHLPYTPWQSETARGFHLWYRHPRVEVPNCVGLQTRDARLKIDVRGDRGFIVVPPSRHANGMRYTWAGDWTASRSKVPCFCPKWLQGTAPITTAPRQQLRGGGRIVERAQAYLATIPRPEIGAGSDWATFYAAGRLTRGFGLNEDVAVDLLWDWAGNRPGWTRAWVSQKVRHAVRYGREPVGALR